ncbi:MAG: Flp pilus assembly complex ATPase component TadA [Gemmatimonadaceae bacterium]|nr:Flp pilus assembly complex ATPase component TadA [Gemmatimonadaceae bacterium]
MSSAPNVDERRARTGGTTAQVDRLLEILRDAVQRGASDIHIRAGDVVYARIHGQLIGLETGALAAIDTREIASHMLATAPNAPSVEEMQDYTGPWSAPGIARFRISILKQRSSFMIVMRVIPDVLPTFESLGLPAAVGRAALADFGLVLVAGIPGSGRSSTIAALIHHLNTNAPTRRHIVSIEGSIEFLHRSQKCSVTQREVGIDTESYEAGIKSALDQDADVIVAGEFSTAETVDLAFRAVEQGRLVIGKIQATDATTTIKSLLAHFPQDAYDAGRLHLAETLRTVIAQRLLPRADGQGRVLASELLFMHGAVRDVLNDPGRLSELRQVLADGRATQGTQTFDQHLADLVIAGKVAFEVAVVLATNSLDFELQLRGLRR